MLSNSNILSSHIVISGAKSVKATTFEKALEKAGMTHQEYMKTLDVLDDATAQIEIEEEHEAIDYLAQSMIEAKKMADIIEGYKFMGSLNLSIANESAHLESEIDKGKEYGSMEKAQTKVYA